MTWRLVVVPDELTDDTMALHSGTSTCTQPTTDLLALCPVRTTRRSCLFRVWCELDDCSERVQSSNVLSATVLSCRESNSQRRGGRDTDKTVLSRLVCRCESASLLTAYIAGSVQQRFGVRSSVRLFLRPVFLALMRLSERIKVCSQHTN